MTTDPFAVIRSLGAGLSEQQIHGLATSDREQSVERNKSLIEALIASPDKVVGDIADPEIFALGRWESAPENAAVCGFSAAVMLASVDDEYDESYIESVFALLASVLAIDKSLVTQVPPLLQAMALQKQPAELVAVVSLADVIVAMEYSSTEVQEAALVFTTDLSQQAQALRSPLTRNMAFAGMRKRLGKPTWLRVADYIESPKGSDDDEMRGYLIGELVAELRAVTAAVTTPT